MRNLKKWATRIGVLLLVLVAMAAAAAWYGTVLAERKMHRTVDVKVKGVAMRDDAAAQERGRYLYASRGCADCHAANGAGRLFVDQGAGFRLGGPNISPGAGSVVTKYTAQDWERAIRHGIAPGGRPLFIMPSEDYNRFTDDDLASLVAWVRHMPPATGGKAVLELPLPVRVLYGFGMMQDAAAKIDHTLGPSQAVPEGVTLEHGAYVANMCKGCHGPALAGGKIPGAPPDWPAAADLRKGGAMTRYPGAKALQAMFKTGKRPDGAALQVMPFESLRELNEVDVGALQMYLQSLPAATQ